MAIQQAGVVRFIANCMSSNHGFMHAWTLVLQLDSPVFTWPCQINFRPLGNE